VLPTSLCVAAVYVKIRFTSNVITPEVRHPLKSLCLTKYHALKTCPVFSVSR